MTDEYDPAHPANRLLDALTACLTKFFREFDGLHLPHNRVRAMEGCLAAAALQLTELPEHLRLDAGQRLLKTLISLLQESGLDVRGQVTQVTVVDPPVGTKH